MSRGISLVNPRELAINPQLVMYDLSGCLWIFASNAIKKVHVEDLFKYTQEELQTVISSLMTTVSTRSGSYFSGVCVDDFFYISTGKLFSQIIKINIITGEITTINTPKNIVMNSNLFYDASKLWMVTNETQNQIDDRHRMYILDIETNTWSSSAITTKKQQEAFRIFSAESEYVYTANWTDFKCSYFDKSTGNFIGSFDFNGYPGQGVSNGEGLAIVPSYGGMISTINGVSNAVVDSYSSIVECNAFGSHIALAGGNIWFHNESSFGFIKPDLTVYINGKVGATVGEVTDLPVNAKNGDMNIVEKDNFVYVYTSDAWVKGWPAFGDNTILKAIDNNSVDSTYTLQKRYSIKNSNYTDIFTIPQYNIIDELGNSVTVKEKIVLVGNAITIFDPDLLKFIFGKPYEFESGTYSSGKAMVTTGETGYIGEFK